MVESLLMKLKVRQKVFILIAMFALPILYLGVQALIAVDMQIGQLKDELRGATEIQSLIPKAFEAGSVEEVVGLKEKIDHISRDSRLVLDSEFDTFYIQQLIAVQISDIAEHFVRIKEDRDALSANLAVLELNTLPDFMEQLRIVQKENRESATPRASLQEFLASILQDETAYTNHVISEIHDGDERKILEYAKQYETISQNICNELVAILTLRVERLANQRVMVWCVFFLTVILLPYAAHRIVTNIGSRLSHVSKLAILCAENRDLGISFNDTGKDEIGEVARSFDKMIRSLKGVIQKITESTSLIGASSSEIAAVSRQQQATTSEIAATTTQIEATSKRITLTTEDLSKTMQQVQTVTAETSALASEGQQGVDGMRATMLGIRESCAEITEKLGTLNQKASRIGNVVTTIAKVADQTNLLSLNAAIEAEKAGEFGNGFAVVAREIRRLADQTASSTIDIEQMIKEIQSAVASGVMGMERFAHDVTKGASEVESTSSQLSTIIGRIQALAPNFETVANGMHSQAIGAKQITESLSQLSSAARQTADSLSQSNSTIEQLHHATVMLKEEGDNFILSHHN